MKKAIRKFFQQQLLVVLAIYALEAILFGIFYRSEFFPFIAVLPALFVLINWIFFVSIIKQTEENISRFSSRFLMVFGIKIFALLAFIVLYAYLNPGHAVIFLITFFIIYLVNTAFVIIKILRYMKNKS